MISLRWTWILFCSGFLRPLLRSPSGCFWTTDAVTGLSSNPVISSPSRFSPLSYTQLWIILSNNYPHSQAFEHFSPSVRSVCSLLRHLENGYFFLAPQFKNVFLWKACQDVPGRMKAFLCVTTSHAVWRPGTALQPTYWDCSLFFSP